MLVRRARTQTSAGIALVDRSTTSSSAKKVDFRVFCAGSSSASIGTLAALPSATGAAFSPLCLFTFWIHRHRTSTTSTVSPPLHLATPPFLFAVAREGAAAAVGWLRESERPPGARWHIRKSQRSESAAPRGHPLITQTTHRIHSLHFYLLVTLPTTTPHLHPAHTRPSTVSSSPSTTLHLKNQGSHHHHRSHPVFVSSSPCISSSLRPSILFSIFCRPCSIYWVGLPMLCQ